MPVYHKDANPMIGRDDSEDGPSARRMYESFGPDPVRAILGFACEEGVHRNLGRAGAKAGPSAIRTALGGLPMPPGMPQLADLGDIIVDGEDLEAGQALLGQHASKALGTFDRVVVLGGGHETAFGSYLGLSAAFPAAKVGIINLDAHLDLRAIGRRGPSSGTPFFQIRERDPAGFDYLCLGVAAESNTQALFERASDWGVRVVDDHALLDSSHAADDEIAAMADRCDVIYLTIDIDLLPHYQAPGVSAPAVRGVPFATVEHLIDTVLRCCREHQCNLPLADIVEVSPPHDRDGMTARSAAVLALRLLAH